MEADERCGPDGPITALDPAERAGGSAGRYGRLGRSGGGVPPVLVSLPDHERELARATRRGAAGVHVSVSSEVLAEIREYERAATTAVDAALTPLLDRYLARLADTHRGRRDCPRLR